MLWGDDLLLRLKHHLAACFHQQQEFIADRWDGAINLLAKILPYSFLYNAAQE